MSLLYTEIIIDIFVREIPMLYFVTVWSLFSWELVREFASEIMHHHQYLFLQELLNKVSAILDDLYDWRSFFTLASLQQKGHLAYKIACFSKVSSLL